MHKLIKKAFFIYAFLICTFLYAQKSFVSDGIRQESNYLVIDSDYNLKGETLILPKGVQLVFRGGKIDNGTLIGDGTTLSIKQSKPLFGLNLTIRGIWNVEDVYDKWFEFNPSPNFVSNSIISNILSLSNDDTFCHIHLDEDRTYYFELPYKGRPDIWNIVSSKEVDGKTVKDWDDIYRERFSFLRIFTIPSNTHLTINNKLQMLPTKSGAYFVFWEYDKTNVVVDGAGSVSGDCKVHPYFKDKYGKFIYSGEWGTLFLCRRCRKFTFKDITLSNALGDCISYCGMWYQEMKGSREGRDLIVRNVKILHARRNGISLGVNNAVIEGCRFEGCGADEIYGTAPRSAIDFESNDVLQFPENGNRDVVMRKCVFKNNKHDVSSTNNNLKSFGKIATFIEDCVFTAPIRFNQTYWIKFKRCKIPSFTNWCNKITENTPFKHIVFEKCEIDSMPAIMQAKSWNNQYIDCNIKKIIR